MSAIGLIASTMQTNTNTTKTSTTKASEPESKSNSASKPASEGTTVAKNADNDTYEKSNSANNVSYKPDRETALQIKTATEQKYEQLSNLINKMLVDQGKSSQMAGAGLGDIIASLQVDQATIDKAKEEVGEDGYWGVKQTSDRILNFAKAITGGDPSKVEEMRKSIQKGFNAAQGDWGKSNMPQITKDTYDAVMKGLDEWAASANQ